MENPEILKKIIGIINSSLNLLCECQRERDIQNILGSQLNCKVRQTLSSNIYPNVEIDVLGRDFALEVKFNERYYSGIGQIIIQKFLYEIKNNILLHVNRYIDDKFIKGFTDLATNLDFLGILIDNKERIMRVVNHNE